MTSMIIVSMIIMPVLLFPFCVPGMILCCKIFLFLAVADKLLSLGMSFIARIFLSVHICVQIGFRLVHHHFIGSVQINLPIAGW